MRERWLTDPVESIEVGPKSVSRLLEEMEHTAFQGRRLGQAVRIWETMLKEEGLAIALGLSGSLSTAGQWKIISWLVRNGLVDILVSTGANITEDIVEGMGYRYWRGRPDAPDAELVRDDVNRYYDVYGSESDYRAMEELLTEFTVSELQPGKRYSAMEVLHRCGLWLASKGIDSILTAAAENSVPVFCPALVDSAFGEALLMAANRDHDITVDQHREFHQFVGIGERVRDIGVIYLGGGVPKDFTQLLAISLSPKNADQEVAGRRGFRRQSVPEYYYPHRYAVQITTDSPQWGGLSGCTLEEAISWGKIDREGERVTCYCDATIALPLLAHALSERLQKDRRGPDLRGLFEQGAV